MLVDTMKMDHIRFLYMRFLPIRRKENFSCKRDQTNVCFQASGTVHLEDGVKYYVNTCAVELHEELDLQQVTDIAEQHGMVNHGQVRQVVLLCVIRLHRA